MTKLIVFDWDDVITLGAKDGYYQCYRETIKELNVILGEREFHERIQRKWGQPYREELRELLKEHPELLDRAVAIYEKKFWGDTFVHALHEVKGANSMLEYLSKKYLLAVATGNHSKMLKEIIIPRFHVPDVFSQIVSGFDIPANQSKPSPYMLVRIMNNLHIDPRECVYVGDAENDVLMAQNAGVEPIVVLTGHLTRERAKKMGVHRILPDMTHLEKIL